MLGFWCEDTARDQQTLVFEAGEQRGPCASGSNLGAVIKYVFDKLGWEQASQAHLLALALYIIHKHNSLGEKEYFPTCQTIPVEWNELI